MQARGLQVGGGGGQQDAVGRQGEISHPGPRRQLGDDRWQVPTKQRLAAREAQAIDTDLAK